MQDSFKEFFVKDLREKGKKASFWLAHIFFFVAIIFVSAAGGLSKITLLNMAIAYPIGAISFEAYQSYQKYKENKEGTK